MGVIKGVKTSQYFKRYQTKWRRRREFKTDYHARKRLIQQDKNKYDSKKHRFVVRKTNTKIICQIVDATPVGDKVLCQASSSELKRFGLTAGLTNYASAYATGLLCARRLLKNLKMDSMYEGNKEVNGEVYDVYQSGDVDDNRRPFKAILDVGITRTTTGNRVFGALKGATDGGLFIPHNNKRFPGFETIKAEGEKTTTNFEAEVHADHIFGGHVQEWMDKLKEKSDADYKKQFSVWDACLKTAKVSSVEDLYKKVHAEIRKNPDFVSSAANKKPVLKKEDGGKKISSSKATWRRDVRLTNDQRKQRVQDKMAKIFEELQG